MHYDNYIMYFVYQRLFSPKLNYKAEHMFICLLAIGHCNLILSNKGVKLLWSLYNNEMIEDKQS